MVKKVLMLILMTTIGLNLLFTKPSFAENSIDKSTDEIIEVSSYPENTLHVIKEETKIITRNEAIKILIRNKGINLIEAGSLLKNSSINQGCSPLFYQSSDSSKKTTYVIATKTYDAGIGTQIEISALLEIGVPSTWQAKRILTLKEKWISLKGKHASFQQDYLTDLTKHYPTQSVTLKGRGTLTHKLSHFFNKDDKNTLKDLGFIPKHAIDGTKYYSTTIDLDFTVNSIKNIV